MAIITGHVDGTIIGTEDADFITAYSDDPREIYGMGGDDTIWGAADDSVYGGEGNDLLVAGGYDPGVLYGGAGDDVIRITYTSSGDDGVVIDGGDGLDTVIVGQALFLHRVQSFADVEIVELGGSRAQLWGYQSQIIDDDGDNRFVLRGWSDGRATNQIVIQMDRDHIDLTRFALENWTPLEDSLVVFGTEGADVMIGRAAGGTFLRGYGGNDIIRGGLLADGIEGSDGFDLIDYSVSSAAVSVNLATGAAHGGDAEGDEIQTVEGLIGSAHADALTGDGGINLLMGGAGADTLDGGAGNDKLVGGTGDDLYVVESGRDRVVEIAGEGRDHVLSSVSFTLGEAVEDLTLTGSAAINAVGNELANRLIGNAGANVLDGAAGADTMAGGAGNDVYVVDDLGDRIVEQANAGTDLVYSSVSFSLAGQYLENLTLTGGLAINGAGNYLDNVIVGNTAANVLNGRSGSDTLTGGAGRDVFTFDAALGPANVDVITDFSVADDMIRLDRAVFEGLAPGFLAASAFATGTAATDALDRIVYDDASGALFFDRDGSGTAYAQVRFATLSPGLALTNADFFVG